MIRAPMGHEAYWTQWSKFGKVRLIKEWALINTPSQNPAYEPQYTFDTGIEEIRHLLTLYSSGAPIRDLAQHIPGLLDAWELSNRLSEEVCREHHLETCRDWDFSLANLNHYNWCFWLVGLGLCLEIADDQWHRLLALVGGEGEDELLDRVIASRNPERRIGTALIHAKPYARLLKTIDAANEQQATLLLDFVQNWYAELKRPAPKDKRAPTIEPFWYIYGDPDKHPMEKGSYFGRWCVEAAAAVKAFGLDDSLCLGHEHYPGDLLRPDGPSTHPVREEPKVGWMNRIFGKKKT